MLPVLALWMMTSAACTPQALTEHVKIAAQSARGNVGVSAIIVEDPTHHFAFEGKRRFPMQSVYKLPIAMAVLREVEAGKLRLDRSVHVDSDDLIPPAAHSPLRDKFPKGGDFTLEELLRRAIVDSDGTASDVLLKVIGGTKNVRRYFKDEHIKGVHVAHTEAQLIDDTHAQYNDYAQPDAMVDLLARLQKGELLNADHTARVLEWMREANTGKDRIRGKLPAGTEVADKTGTSGTLNDMTAATNDIGIIRLPNGQHLAIAIFVSDSRATTAITRNAIIATISRELWDCWTEEQK